VRQLVIKVLNIIDARCNHEVHIQGVSGGIVNILGGSSMDYSEYISSYKHVSNFSMGVEIQLFECYA